MSTPPFLLETDPHLEGDVADGKADPSAWPGICLALAGSMDHQCVKTGWTFLRSSCHSGYTVLANRVVVVGR